jgi:2-oxoglutarate ferredoxin oxidoreductase subunit alpha
VNSAPKSKHAGDVSIVLCGQAGQGIQTVERLLTHLAEISGYHVFATKEYMSRVRGGMNSTEIRLSNQPVRASVNRIDVAVALDSGATKHLGQRITAETIVIGDKTVLNNETTSRGTFLDVPFGEIGAQAGNKVYSNTVAVGALAGLLKLKADVAGEYMKRFFAGKADEVIRGNVTAFNRGYEIISNLSKSVEIQFDISPSNGSRKRILINGAEAVGLGAIAGGCNFVSSYPMSPSTPVLVFLAQHGRDFGVLVEQAEDEIAAINMAIGAWYAGAQAMVTTSGGGFALMIEGLSLAGMLESPLVIHLAQRPGPATGLPTRTEQADLELALYAGHGEFPRIILAPDSIESALTLACRAFDLADRFQVPVFILTDQHLMDSYYDVEPPDLSRLKCEKHFVETTEDYKRYRLTADGVSPRGIPGFGKGLVCVDSDEHDEYGHITEDLELRTKMVDKRLAKLALIKDEIVPPVLIGPKNYRTLVICWGSTRNAVVEAVARLGTDDVAALAFSQVYPLHPATAELLNKARKTVIVEGNATAQFARLLKIHTGVDIQHKILKYDDLGFAADELADKLKSIL